MWLLQLDERNAALRFVKGRGLMDAAFESVQERGLQDAAKSVQEHGLQDAAFKSCERSRAYGRGV